VSVPMNHNALAPPGSTIAGVDCVAIAAGSADGPDFACTPRAAFARQAGSSPGATN
jgi:hypothetical protein